MQALDKTYNPSERESHLYQQWEEQGCFKVGRVPEAEPYTIVIPPPNVTGSLHMGHALNNTLQDILCRFERLRGRDVLWQAGTDHAGIATQMVVERQLAEGQEESRHDMGRAAFVERVWQWKEESGNIITQQLRRLGASCDWSRERFTMDEGLSQAVLKVFVTLYEQGLIYKDKRLVNWDPGLLTAISDLEVEPKEVNGHLWHFNYPLADSDGHITVATTRPETMLGDSAVAVHPHDERYQHLIGKHVILPIVGRKIPIIADDYADPEQGSGAVKITPAHDFNDFEVGKRHNLAQINMLDKYAQIDLSDPAFADMPDRDAWQGMARMAARAQIVDKMQALGLLVAIEDHPHMVPFGDRSNEIIEPWLTDQWYVDAKTLAAPAIKAVEEGKMQFAPAHWQKTYYEWMYNIQPWCISRQLWWGHQIPAWYGPDGHIFVAYNEQEAQEKAATHYGESVSLRRDEDVLDTWFSSALWPFSTLGWPETTDILARHYPTSVLVTGFDILFFWVARMMMMGLHFIDEIPFPTVYMHALVRDEKGAKMSKSKGNVIDPLELIDTYGADALRFTLTAMAAMGRDIKLSEQRVEGYRNFATKLWNAARFCEMNDCFSAAPFEPAQAQLPLNQWLVGRVINAQNAITNALEAYRFNEAAQAVYQFIRGAFCDWYVELAKPILQADAAPHETEETRAALNWGFTQALHLLHPFMPFITEELWQKTGTRDGFLMLSSWPNLADDLTKPDADAAIDWVIGVVSEIRSVRAEMNVPASAQINVELVSDAPALAAYVETYDILLKRLARLSKIEMKPTPSDTTIQTVYGQTTIALELAGVIDMEVEKARLSKDMAKREAEIKKLSGKLASDGFLQKAPAHVVDENHERLAAEQEIYDKLAKALKRLDD